MFSAWIFPIRPAPMIPIVVFFAMTSPFYNGRLEPERPRGAKLDRLGSTPALPKKKLGERLSTGFPDSALKRGTTARKASQRGF